jgi:hypothetical protein
VVVVFGRWALRWLRDDLTAYAKLADQNNPDANKLIRQRMTHWRSDADLVFAREMRALDRLVALLKRSVDSIHSSPSTRERLLNHLMDEAAGCVRGDAAGRVGFVSG